MSEEEKETKKSSNKKSKDVKVSGQPGKSDPPRKKKNND